MQKTWWSQMKTLCTGKISCTLLLCHHGFNLSGPGSALHRQAVILWIKSCIANFELPWASANQNSFSVGRFFFESLSWIIKSHRTSCLWTGVNLFGSWHKSWYLIRLQEHWTTSRRRHERVQRCVTFAQLHCRAVSSSWKTNFCRQLKGQHKAWCTSRCRASERGMKSMLWDYVLMVFCIARATSSANLHLHWGERPISLGLRRFVKLICLILSKNHALTLYLVLLLFLSKLMLFPSVVMR